MSSQQITPLMRASATGNKGAVIEFLNEGFDVNQKGPRDSTALMFAASGGHYDVVKVLVEHGAEIDAKEEGGWDALEHAAHLNDDMAEYEEVVLFLNALNATSS